MTYVGDFTINKMLKIGFAFENAESGESPTSGVAKIDGNIITNHDSQVYQDF